MNQHRARQFVSELSENLRQLGDMLVTQRLINDPGPLLSAAAATFGKPTAASNWGYQYDVFDLTFRLDKRHFPKLKTAHPKELDNLEVRLNVHVKGQCTDSSSEMDPLCSLSTEFLLVSDVGGITHEASWHLDRHIRNDDETGNPGEFHFCHPIYHFQHGGRRLSRKLNKGCTLELESPRLAHPPLDAVLAADFVVANFFYDEWNNLSQVPGYADVLRHSQDLYWRPYAVSTQRHWVPSQAPAGELAPKAVWPTLL